MKFLKPFVSPTQIYWSFFPESGNMCYFPRSVITKYHKLGSLHNIYCLTVLEARNLRSKCWLEVWRPLGGILPCLSYLLVKASNSLPFFGCRCITPVSASTFTWCVLFLFFKKMCLFGLVKAHGVFTVACVIFSLWLGLGVGHISA